MKLIIISIVMVVALVLAAVVEFRSPCLRSHPEQVWVPPTTFMMIGKVLLPIVTSGRWVTESVCDEYGRSRWARRRR